LVSIEKNWNFHSTIAPTVEGTILSFITQVPDKSLIWNFHAMVYEGHGTIFIHQR
jgi:hypothetical protein